nr:lichenase-like [Ipomoea trifida]
MAAMFLLGFLMAVLEITGAHESIGICYGTLGSDLAPAPEVIQLYKTINITKMRLYNPNAAALQALRGSNIQLTLGVQNEDLMRLASDRSAAYQWVQENVRSYWPEVRFRYIAVGNEISPVKRDTASVADYVLPAIRNIHAAVSSAGLQNDIKVSTSVDMTLLSHSFPPSEGRFSDDLGSYVKPIVEFLANTNSPLLVNIYPYFTHTENPADVSLPYALFTSPAVEVWDGEFGYRNLFDAMLDATYAAVSRAGGANVEIVVSESGWPSAGGLAATPENAFTYTKNLIRHVKGGTPRRPNKAIEVYLFAMFDENSKPGPELERNFGLFSPNKQAKYPLDFSA